jgi:hypothetical protein
MGKVIKAVIGPAAGPVRLPSTGAKAIKMLKVIITGEEERLERSGLAPALGAASDQEI